MLCPYAMKFPLLIQPELVITTLHTYDVNLVAMTPQYNDIADNGDAFFVINFFRFFYLIIVRCNCYFVFCKIDTDPKYIYILAFLCLSLLLFFLSTVLLTSSL